MAKGYRAFRFWIIWTIPTSKSNNKSFISPLSHLFYSVYRRCPLWKWVVTSAENNTEFKLWSCEEWKCHQTIRFKSSDSAPIVQKMTVDASASFLLVSDIHRKVTICIHLHKYHIIKFILIFYRFFTLCTLSKHPFLRWKMTGLKLSFARLAASLSCFYLSLPSVWPFERLHWSSEVDPSMILKAKKGRIEWASRCTLFNPNHFKSVVLLSSWALRFLLEKDSIRLVPP